MYPFSWVCDRSDSRTKTTLATYIIYYTVSEKQHGICNWQSRVRDSTHANKSAVNDRRNCNGRRSHSGPANPEINEQLASESMKILQIIV